jgi:uncharacterized repeat protein (TIGR01451 family)
MRDIRILCAAKAAASLISSFAAQSRQHLSFVGDRALRILMTSFMLLLAGIFATSALAQESICAEVKIEIKQKLSLERQAFDAVLKINNGLADLSVENVSVSLWFKDEAGNAVISTSDANNTTASFFVRQDSLTNLTAIDGTGVVPPKSSGSVKWLIIPTVGAGGLVPSGKIYQVGAQLSYKLGSQVLVVDVAPETITVKPQPQLVLDYFLPGDVYADDAFTPQTEPAEPFTLGVRVKNVGGGVAKAAKIESAQPKIIENKQGLLIGFQIIESYLQDAPADKTLLINFGDIQPSASKMGRWNMLTTLAGRFTEFTAEYSHADSLGGSLTSLIQAVNTRLLVHDVKVDLPGRDNVRDFLAIEGNGFKVYESDGVDNNVTDQSGAATLQARAGGGYDLVFPATTGLAYAKVTDPNNGNSPVGTVTRSDGKVIPSENSWLSKKRNTDNITFSYFINFFDTNTTGRYQVQLAASNFASLSGVVFDDVNANGTKEPAEPGIGTTQVTLGGTNASGQTVNTPAYADQQGAWSFVGLQPGTYSLKVSSSPNRVDGIHTAGSAGGVVGADAISTIQLSAGSVGNNYLFAKKLAGNNNGTQADIALGLTVSPVTVLVNQNVTLVYRVLNNGPAAANAVQVSVPLVAGLTLVSSTATTGSVANGVWTVGNLAASQNATLTVVAKVTATTPVTVTGTASSSTPDPNSANNSASGIISVNAKSADVRITTTTSTQTDAAGKKVFVLVNAANFGPDVAEALVVNVTLPANLTSVSQTPTAGTYANGVWTIGTLSANTSATLRLVFTLADVQPAVVTAQVSATTAADPETANNTSAIAINASGAQADLNVVTTTSVRTLAANTEFLLTTNVTNNGADTAANVSVANTIPAGLIVLGSLTNKGSFDAATKAWSVGSLGAGQIATITHRLQSSTTSAVDLLSAATSATTDPVLADNNSLVKIGTALPDLALTSVTTPLRAGAGVAVSNTLTVTNNGPANATNVRVDLLVPSAFAVTDNVASVGTVDLTNGVWTVGNLEAGTSATLTITGSASTPQSIEFFAQATASEADVSIADNIAQSSVDTLQSDVAVAIKADRATQTINKSVKYTVTATNFGPDIASGISVLVARSAGLSITASSTLKGTFDAATGIWTLGDLLDNKSATLSITALVNSTNLTETVTASAQPLTQSVDLNPANNQATATINSPTEANLSVTQTAPASVAASSTYAYNMVVTNAGPAAVNDARLTNNIPETLKVLSITCSAAAGAICPAGAIVPINAQSITIPTLRANGIATFTVTVQAPKTLNTSITNVASISPPSGVIDKVTTDNSASVKVVTTAGSKTVLAATASTTTYLNPATVTATVTNGIVGGPVPTGNVLFRRDGVPAAILSLDATGKAVLVTRTLARGQRLMTAEYLGDAANPPSTSGTTKITVGAPVPAVTLSAPKLDFTDQAVLSESVEQTIVLTNSGNAPLNISAITLTGTNKLDFNVGGTCVAGSQAIDAECTLIVKFKPTALGTRTATLTVKHNASPASSAITLKGIAVAPQTVTTFTEATPTATGDFTASFTGGGVACTFTTTGTLAVTGDVNSPADPIPATWSFPHGLARMEASNCTSGSRLTFTFTFPAAVPTTARLWVYGKTITNATPAWFQITGTNSGNTVTVNLTDGANGDIDITKNGMISTLVGLGTK